MEPFKNAFSYPNACRIATRILDVHPAFPMAAFRRGLEEELEPLELKQRMRSIALRIEAGLPESPELFPILVKTLARNEDDPDGLRGFLVWPLTDIVARRGLDHFEESMAALREMTRVFTAEFAIRPFLREHRQRTLRHMKKWAKDPDEHVRRLVSEGTRPLLPWGERLPELMADPGLAMPLLEILHRDKSDYVRLSVSNHLNDFSKSHPELVLETLAKWRDAGKPDAGFAKLARHACRTLIKQGHPQALSYHGFGSADSLEIEEFSLLTPAVEIGGHLEYRLRVRNTSPAPLRVLYDYAILHRKANGSQTPKVFKGRVRELAGGEIWEITGRHPMKPVTTRVYHSGRHAIEPRLNGRAFPALDFDFHA
ncbi:DNA alkylation repair protein [Luteolibacter yonseiensis]|uniref:DNA alkylation repair protein n=1 Tax=Luteolibacter yonseiensis TaxID=1144680 RepID=A0A934R3N5_9BACT|nr:DNA alkylation repair protein [Luteolibacter yonseiensis]MBK1814890.1 DNA alkylation repair protein [Luteolibacter yonseiensis]